MISWAGAAMLPTTPSPKLRELLEQLLIEQFRPADTAGLRRFMTSIDAAYEAHLPTEPASLAHVAHEAVALLYRYNAVPHTLEQLLPLLIPLNIKFPQTWQIFRRRHEYGSGTVHYLHNTVSQRSEALKTWSVHPPDDEVAHTHLKHGAQHFKDLHHPRLVPIYEVVSDPAHVSILMEFIRDPTLAEWQFERNRTLEDVIEVYIAAGEGLAALHKAGLLHRNFKPSNVFVERATAFEDSRKVRLAGFGMQRDGTPYTGNPFYASPEHCNGGRLTPRSDQFSFCVALHHALFSVHPYFIPGANTIRMADSWDDPPQPSNAQHEYFVAKLKESLEIGLLLRPQHIPERFQNIYAVITQGLELNPDKRHESMTTLIALLKTALTQSTVRTSPRRRWPAAAPASFAVALLAVTIFRRVETWSTPDKQNTVDIQDTKDDLELLGRTPVPFAPNKPFRGEGNVPKPKSEASPHGDQKQLSLQTRQQRLPELHECLVSCAVNPDNPITIEQVENIARCLLESCDP